MSQEQPVEQYVASLSEFINSMNAPSFHQKRWYKVFSSVEHIFNRVVKTMRKAMAYLPKNIQGKSTQTSRRTSKTAKAATSSASSRGNDPDPEPAPLSSFIFYFKPVIPYVSFISLISLFSFIITSTLEVMK